MIDFIQRNSPWPRDCRPPRWPTSRRREHSPCRSTSSSRIIRAAPSGHNPKEPHHELTSPSPYQHPPHSPTSSASSFDPKPHSPSIAKWFSDYQVVCSYCTLSCPCCYISKTPFANMQYRSLPHLHFSLRSGTGLVKLLHASPRTCHRSRPPFPSISHPNCRRLLRVETA